MSGLYKAPVFNSHEMDFMVSAEMAKPLATINDEPRDVLSLLREPAHGLETYLSHYLDEVVEPFNYNVLNDELLGNEFSNPRRVNSLIFAEGSVMAFQMVDGVHMMTGFATPSLKDDLGSIALSNCDLEASSLLDVYFRGRELRKKLHHLYRPVLKLLENRTGIETSELATDLSVPLTQHGWNTGKGLSQLHFIGGAAETLLMIEDTAQKQIK